MNILVRKIQDNRLIKTLGIIILVILMGYFLGKAALDPGKARLLIASSFIFILIVFSIRKPALALYLLILYLPFLGLFRRALIPVAGWNTLDPLVIVGPAVVLILVFKWFYDKSIHREIIADDTRLFQLIRWMLLIDCIQIFNPIQGSLFTGIAGIIFYIVPIGYMILGREYIDEKKIKMIFATVFFIGVIVALYGFKQYFYGYYPFEDMWVELSGYTALKVYGVMRPISTFTSASEYAHYLGIAIVIAWAYILRSGIVAKIFGIVGLLLLYSALFTESARGAIVTATLALVIISIVNSKKLSNKILVSLIACGVMTGMFFAMSKLNTENDLIYHSVVGLTDPMGEESTTLGHYNLMIDGFLKGFTNPLGHGLGSTTIAAGKFSGSAVSSEVDLSNKFLATGIVGGILYLIIMIKILFIAFKQANSSIVHLVILGVLFSQAGQWLNGGHYSVVGLIWIMIGYLDKNSTKKEVYL
ncbi:hypothetical protein [Cohnella luojiensis]|uniref:O-antigen ligase domain-containing protein n=1 Tax=Cohnella luojiensis TaxID=652876 RepID=A0A4Y8LNT6_9BACL|nr:hypothetical protein [Cohnella luojiensis]TFE22640.1 hypothetical protein E2980_21470 [Cohnella luojiensis]